MADVAQFTVQFDTTDAQRNVDALADATESAMNRMEQESQQSLSASGQDMERLADAFRSSGNIIESAITALIEKEEALAKQTKDTADEGSTFGKAFSAVGTGLAAAGTAIAATVTALGALVQHTTAATVETANYADAVGISTEAMQAFDFAAQRVGGDTDALRESLRTSQDAVAQFVNDGTGPAAEALELFGLQLTDSAGKVRSMEQLMPELVTALGNIQDPAERSRLAIQLFGEEDSRTMLALANNPKILSESASALEKYGLVMGEDLVAQSRAFQTGVTDLMASLQGLAQELVSALLPTINALLPQFTAWVVSLRESDTVQKELIPTLQAIIGYLGEVGTAVTVLRAGWAALNVAFNAVVMGILEGVGKIAQGLGTIITAAGTAADVLGMEGVADKLRSAGGAVTEVGNAIDEMGDIARESMQEWQQSLSSTISSLGQTTTATNQTTSATRALGQAATTAGKEVTDATKAMAEETAKAQQQAKELREAYLDLGIKSTESLKKLADAAVADFKTIHDSGAETGQRLAAIWVDEVVPQIIDAYGTIPPALAQYDQMIRAGAEQTLSSLGQLLEQLGIQTREQLRTTAAEAESNLLTIVSIYGIRSKEAAQAFETTIADIKAYHDELPPHIQRIADQITGSHRDAATESVTVHRQAVQQMVAIYQDGFQRINGIIDATTGVIDNGGFQWGNTLEELQAQLAQTRTEYNNWSRAVGIPLDIAEFQMKRLNEIINELQRRIRDLQSQEQESTTTTDRFAGSLVGLGSALRGTTAAMGEMTTARVALNAAMEDAPLYSGALGAGVATRRPTTRTGGVGGLGEDTGSGGRAGGGGGGDSIVIGQGPPQLPLGVPLPSDLGLPEGGVSFPTNRSSLGRSSLTQNTVVNINEPITIHTKADSNALTSQAIADGINASIRRGIVRPELGSGLR